MRTIVLTALLALTASAAQSQDWALRAGDTQLSRAEALDLTAGRTLTFYDDGQSKFSVGGAYSYTYANNGGTAYGRFEVGDDGEVCIHYRNGFSRCDLYVRNGDRLVLLTEKGERYPIRP